MKKFFSFIFALTLAVSASAATIEVACTDVQLTNATATEGWFQFIAKSSAYSSIYICVNSTSVAGTYTTANLDLDYTALYDLQDAQITITGGNGTVTVSGDTTSFDFNLSDASGNIYHVYGANAPDIYKYDEETNWNADFTNGVYDDQYLSSLGVVLITGENTTDNATVTLQYYGNSIPAAGTYSFSNESIDGTFIPGCTDGTYLYGSYINTADYTKIWYLVSGSITIAANGDVTLNAVNSKGKTITGTIYIGATALENVNSNANLKRKYIRNGQLHIIHEGATFNAQGAKL